MHSREVVLLREVGRIEGLVALLAIEGKAHPHEYERIRDRVEGLLRRYQLTWVDGGRVDG